MLSVGIEKWLNIVEGENLHVPQTTVVPGNVKPTEIFVSNVALKPIIEAGVDVKNVEQAPPMPTSIYAPRDCAAGDNVETYPALVQ